MGSTIDTALGLAAVFLLILGNAFFVAVEFALVAVDRDRVHVDAEAGSLGARATARALRQLSFHLSGCQLGITATSLVVGFVAEPTVAAAIEPVVGELVGDQRALGVSITLALVVATVVQMVMGELVPKSVAIARPRRAAYLLAPAILVVDRAAGPLIRFLNGAANATVRRLGIEPREELASVRSPDELERLIRSSGEQGTLEPEATQLMTRSLRFRRKDAADALVPRLAVETVSAEATAADLTDRAAATGHSRFPVVRADLDDVVGVVHVKDVYAVPYDERSTTPVTDLAGPAFVVPDSRHLDDLLGDLRRTGSHLAIVVDEHGGTAGVITLEDVLEEIVGDIVDEHDVAVSHLTQRVRPGEWLLDGTLHADEVFDACGFRVPEGGYETLAGFVLDRLGHLPEPGERFRHDGWVVEVAARDRLRVSSVRLRRMEASGDAPWTDGGGPRGPGGPRRAP